MIKKIILVCLLLLCWTGCSDVKRIDTGRVEEVIELCQDGRLTDEMIEGFMILDRMEVSEKESGEFEGLMNMKGLYEQVVDIHYNYYVFEPEILVKCEKVNIYIYFERGEMMMRWKDWEESYMLSETGKERLKKWYDNIKKETLD